MEIRNLILPLVISVIRVNCIFMAVRWPEQWTYCFGWYNMCYQKRKKIFYRHSNVCFVFIILFNDEREVKIIMFKVEPFCIIIDDILLTLLTEISSVKVVHRKTYNLKGHSSRQIIRTCSQIFKWYKNYISMFFSWRW